MEMGQGLADLKLGLAILRGLHGHGPLPRPPDGVEHPTLLRLQTTKRQGGAVGGTTPLAGHPIRSFRRQENRPRPVGVRRRITSVGVTKTYGRSPGIPDRIHRQDFFQDSGGLRSLVPKKNRPFAGRIKFIPHDHHPNLQTWASFRKSQSSFRLAALEFFFCP